MFGALAAISTLGVQPAVASTAPVLFKVGKRTLEGRQKIVCVIEGEWRGGEPFRYEAWDSCSEMHVRQVDAKDFVGAQALGQEDKPGLSEIPPSAEILEISNDFSSVLVFRDAKGETQEVLIRD